MEEVRESVKEFYGRAAFSGSCCGPSCSCDAVEATDDVLEGPSLGCGSPLEGLSLSRGMDVLDIGCGAGREVIKVASRIGPEGLAYGLDMTDEMLRLAMENRRRAGAHNVVLLRGTMESIPLPAESVDAIISNCVINLSPDKAAAAREMFRVLRPGGVLSVSDTVVDGIVPDEDRRDPELWSECLSGAMTVDEYTSCLSAAGFSDVRVRVEKWIPVWQRQWRVGFAMVSAKRAVSNGG
ncbi:MAG: methyltransferase domain-containing protein, partial [Firmicutes bacterium]|nr:methyltransferase domain-containing protein [Bacillota bacterium]